MEVGEQLSIPVGESLKQKIDTWRWERISRCNKRIWDSLWCGWPSNVTFRALDIYPDTHLVDSIHSLEQMQ